MRAAILLAVLATTGTSAFAEGNSNEVSLGSFTRSLRSSSANAVSDENLSGGNLGYSHQLHLDVLPNLQLWGTAGFTWGGATGTMFQTLSTEVDMIGFTAGGRAVYSLHRRVGVSARVDIGTARTALTLRGNDHTVSDSGWGGVSGAAAGLDLLAIAHRSFKLGIRFELGYLTATAPALSPREEQADETKIELEAMQASIGHLDLGGRYFALTFLSQF